MLCNALLLMLICCLPGDVASDSTGITPGTAVVVEDSKPTRFYARVEFLWWWMKQDEVPPLVTTGPDGTTGLPGDPGVSLIYGGEMQSRHDRFIGVRPTLGLWFNDCRTVGVEASAIFLERDSSILHIKRVTTPLFQLYEDANTGQVAAEQFAGVFPNGVVRRGSIQVYGRKELYVEDLRGLVLLQEDQSWRWYGIVGAKFAQFRNQLNNVMTGLDEPDLNVLYGVTDNFYSYDRFYGGQVGLRLEAERGPWQAQLTLSSGIGANEQRIRIDGQREVRTPLTQDVRPVGLHVQYTNTGDWSRWVFDAIPELNLNVSWGPCEWFRVQAGYSLIYWMRVLRASDQLDAVNTNQIVEGPEFTGQTRPILPWKETSFWTQGLSLGVEVRW